MVKVIKNILTNDMNDIFYKRHYYGYVLKPYTCEIDESCGVAVLIRSEDGKLIARIWIDRGGENKK